MMMCPASACIRITKGAPDILGSADAVSNLCSGENFFSGTTWDSAGCCARPACCDLTETDAKNRRMSSVEVCLGMMSSCFGRLAWTLLGYFETRACTRVKIIIAEGFLQTQKRGFAGAVAGGDLFELPFVLQAVHEPVNFGFGRAHEMKTAAKKMHVRINRRGGLQDFLDSRVRTTEPEIDRLVDSL